MLLRSLFVQSGRLPHGFGKFAALFHKEDKLLQRARFGPASFLTDKSKQDSVEDVLELGLAGR